MDSSSLNVRMFLDLFINVSGSVHQCSTVLRFVSVKDSSVFIRKPGVLRTLDSVLRCLMDFLVSSNTSQKFCNVYWRYAFKVFECFEMYVPAVLICLFTLSKSCLLSLLSYRISWVHNFWFVLCGENRWVRKGCLPLYLLRIDIHTCLVESLQCVVTAWWGFYLTFFWLSAWFSLYREVFFHQNFKCF